MSALVADGQAEIAVELGVGRQGQRGVWDAGSFDQAVWGQSDTSLGDWVDVTCFVINGSLTLSAGSSTADGVVTRWEAASCAFVLVGQQWNPWQGPYAGVVGPAVPVRVRWRSVTVPPADLLAVDTTQWQLAFTGMTDDDGYTWNPAHESQAHRSTAAFGCTDGTRLLAGFDGLEQTAVGQGETSSARVLRILDTALWPAALRDVTAGGVTLKATTLAEAAWTMLLQVCDTDLALLWVKRDGSLAFRPEGRVKPPLAVNATLTVCASDEPGAVQVTDLIGGQPRVIRNMVAVSRQARDDTDQAVTVSLINEQSVARYFAHRYSRTDLIHTDDAWSTTVAEAILSSSAWPSAAPASADLSSRLGDPAVPTLLLSLEPNMALKVSDDTTVWLCAPIGWEVAVSRREISGRIDLLDVSGWISAEWDASNWDDADAQWWGVS